MTGLFIAESLLNNLDSVNNQGIVNFEAYLNVSAEILNEKKNTKNNYQYCFLSWIHKEPHSLSQMAWLPDIKLPHLLCTLCLPQLNVSNPSQLPPRCNLQSQNRTYF